jgi:ACS family hexuronate transporter-like MFS transporter
MNGAPAVRPDSWRWTICGLLLLATMLNYMDRQTLAQLATTIQAEFKLNDNQYGELEMGFGFAFAAGALFFGYLVDRLSPRWLYPAVLIGWSLAGIATGYADRVAEALPSWLAGEDRAFHGFLVCRVVLGFFEAGHWPCALVTTQVILTRQDRSLGNSILQSGAAIGAILTPLIVLSLLSDEPGSWRGPFLVIGAIGMLWTLPWLSLVRGRDLERLPAPRVQVDGATGAEPAVEVRYWRMFLVLIVVVITINLTWQFFRAWLPKFLEEQRGYTKREVGVFTSAYYIAADVGCISVGIVVKWLATRGWDVHQARLATFALCAGLTFLSVPVAYLAAGPLLLGLLLLVAAGSLGLFPNYYAFTQELTRVHQGKVSGSLGTITWVSSSLMQKAVGSNINATKSYTEAIVMAGLVPLLALAALWFFWPRQKLAGVSVGVARGGTRGTAPADAT